MGGPGGMDSKTAGIYIATQVSLTKLCGLSLVWSLAPVAHIICRASRVVRLVSIAWRQASGIGHHPSCFEGHFT